MFWKKKVSFKYVSRQGRGSVVYIAERVFVVCGKNDTPTFFEPDRLEEIRSQRIVSFRAVRSLFFRVFKNTKIKLLIFQIVMDYIVENRECKYSSLGSAAMVIPPASGWEARINGLIIRD